MGSTLQCFGYFSLKEMVLMRTVIFQTPKAIAAPSLSAVLCHSLDPAQTQGLVSVEAKLVVRDISSTNRLVNSHAFGSSFIVSSLIWNFYVPSSLIFCQKVLCCRQRLWCLHVLLLSCSVNSKQEMKTLHQSSFLQKAASQVLYRGQSIFLSDYPYLNIFWSMNSNWQTH